MDEREHPRARLRTLRHEPRRRAPEREEALLDGVFGERVVPEDPEGKPVRDPAEAVVELAEGRLVTARDQRHQGFVGQVSKIPPRAHRRVLPRGDGPRYHWRGNGHSGMVRRCRPSGSARKSA